MPAAGLDPDAESYEVVGLFELVGVFFDVEADEVWVFSGAFVFSSGLEFDDFFDGGLEEDLGEWEVAEEVTFTVFHGEDEVVAVDFFEELFDSAWVPDEVTDGVGADCPGAADDDFVVLFEHWEQALDELVCFLGGFDEEFIADLAFDVISVAFS